MNSARALRKEFGDLAGIVGRRLDDLAAIETLDQAFELPGRFEPLTGNRAGQYSLRLSGNMRMILEPAGDPIPQREDGGTDLTAVTAITIIEIVDYH